MSSDSLPLAVNVDSVTKRYGSLSSPVLALQNVSVSVGHDERIAILGKSGSGKSTLLNLLGGLDHPTSGHIRCVGRDLAQLTSRELSRFRSTSVGMIFQSFNLISSRTALQNVELPMVFAGLGPRERRTVAIESLKNVGLGHRIQHRPTALSGGENQRVAVARALVNRPRLILADEPTGNLDSATAREVMRLILDYVESNRAALVLITHDEDLARLYTTRTIRLRDGGLLCD